MNYKSQIMRKKAPELDPLRLGSGWNVTDLSKAQIYIGSTYGDSHPGSAHLNKLVDIVKESIYENGGFGARYFYTDICDGESQGTEGINYSLVSREMIANLIEIQTNSVEFDSAVFISSCDKGVPGSLMGMLRKDIPSIFLPGGVMKSGPNLLTLEQLGMYSAKYKRNEISYEKFDWAKKNACPSCGACSFIGTALTMQIMAEALGLALPGSAVLIADSKELIEYSKKTGEIAVKIAGDEKLRPSKILTKKSFENAILIHAAISGSTNALLHIPAIANEVGITIDGDTFDQIHKKAHYLLNIRPTGKWPAEVFYYAGGVPAIMEEYKEILNLDELTITGKTIGENLEDLKNSNYYDECNKYLENFNKKFNLKLKKDDIIYPYDNPISKNGSVTILKGNIAPEGSVIKHTATSKKMFDVVLTARTFDSEKECLDSVINNQINEGEALIVRYAGPASNGMPEMFYLTEAISSNEKLAESVALITDGRFSGGSKGPVIGHCSPEAFRGGPISIVEDGDLIEISIVKGKINIVGVDKTRLPEEEIKKIISKRKENWNKPKIKYKKGVLRILSDYVSSPFKGAYLDFEKN